MIKTNLFIVLVFFIISNISLLSAKDLYELSKKSPAPSAWLLANSCAGCYGTNGAEFDTSIPPLAGMDKDAFIAMMQAYKSEKIVKSSVMTMVAKQLNDKEIKLMADYFSKQKATQWSAKKWSKNAK